MATRGYDLFPPRRRAGRPPFAQDGFVCKHCRNFVSSAFLLSGVHNRNHCPYCLWSRHLDLEAAGDRLSACKAPMRPIGLTIKLSRRKYGFGRGELMLIHQCSDCGRLSINRLAADDDPESIFSIFEQSLRMEAPLRQRLASERILPLLEKESASVRSQLFGALDRPGLLPEPI
jgi:hypothetical protein